MASLQAEGRGGGQSEGERHRGQGQRGRGRGRGGGQRGGFTPSTTEVRRGRGGRGGGGGRGGANAMSAGELSARFSGKPDVEVEQSLGTHGVKKLDGGEGEVKGGDTEAEVCWICASSIVHESIAPCNHRTCHICCLRMRALYKDKNCAHCRVCHFSFLSFFLRLDADGMDRRLHRTLSSQTILQNGMRISRTAISRARTRISGSGMRVMISGKIRFYS
jgi:hypothetical protein